MLKSIHKKIAMCICIMFTLTCLSIANPNEVNAAAGSTIDESGIGQSYYVNASSGNDNNNGTSSSTPFKTIGKAVTAAAAPLSNGTKTKISIANGTYREYIDVPGDYSTLLVIEGAEKGKVIISGSDEYTFSTWTNEGNGVYSRAWNKNFGFYDGNSGAYNVDFILAHRREMVFINDTKLKQVMVENWTYNKRTDGAWSGQGSWTYNGGGVDLSIRSFRFKCGRTGR